MKQSNKINNMEYIQWIVVAVMVGVLVILRVNNLKAQRVQREIIRQEIEADIKFFKENPGFQRFGYKEGESPIMRIYR